MVRTILRPWERRPRRGAASRVRASRASGRLTRWTPAAWAIALVIAAFSCAIPVIGAQEQATPAAEAMPAAAETSDTPVTCRIGIALTGLYTLSVATESFDADFWIWSLCPDDRYLPLSSMEFVNANSVSINMEGGEVVDGVHWHYARVKGTFRHYWDESNFPFDRQHLRIVMEESDAYADELVYEPDIDGQIHEPDLLLTGWRIDTTSLAGGVHTYHTAYGDPADPGGTSAYARLVLDIELERDELTGFITLTVLVYSAFVISIINFFIHPVNRALLAARMAITSATLFTVALSLRTASQDLNSADRVTMVDWIHIAALVAIMIDAVAALATWLLVRRGRPAADVERFNRVVMVAVAVGFVAVNILLLGRAAMR